mgnify:CR=1 FL=1
MPKRIKGRRGISKYGLIILLGFAYPVCGQITVGIADFENQTERIYLDGWAQKIPNFLQSELSGTPGVELVERQDIQAILDERALSQSGLLDSTAAEKVQTLTGADYLIAGTLSRTGEWFRIDARIVSAATGKVVSEKVRCRDERYLGEMVSLLGKNLAHQLTGKGGRQERMKLKRFPVRPGAYVTAGLGLATLLVHLQYDQKHRDYLNETDISGIDSKYVAANRLSKTRGSVFIATGASALITLFFWSQNLTSDVILASEPPVLPLLWADGEGSWSIGLAMRL